MPHSSRWAYLTSAEVLERRRGHAPRLTGESLPATKRVASQSVSPPGAGTAYPEHRVLRGTMVQDGHGILCVTAVGDSPEIGKTARAAAENPQEPTPLTRQLERLSKVIGVF